MRRESDGKLQLKCNADGVPLVGATATCQLSSVNYLDEVDIKFGKRFIYEISSESEHGYHPLVLQLTKFSCGGFAIGMSLSHSVCDGFGAAQFFRALTELASGKIDPYVKPIWRRGRLVGGPTPEPLHFPVDMDSLATSPYLPTSDVVHGYFNVTARSIKKLKLSLLKEAVQDNAPNESFTTLEVLSAYVWRSRLRALKLDSNGKCCLYFAVGIRGLLDPPLPEGYYGNAFISANVVLPGRDLDEGSLTKVVKLIKQSKKLASSPDYIMRSLINSEKIRQQNVKIEGATGASMILTDWRQLGLSEDEDFGWKEAVNMTPVPTETPWLMDVCLFMPPPRLHSAMKGGVRVFVSLPRAAMAKFKEEMSALMLGVDEIAKDLL